MAAGAVTAVRRARPSSRRLAATVVALCCGASSGVTGADRPSSDPSWPDQLAAVVSLSRLLHALDAPGGRLGDRVPPHQVTGRLPGGSGVTENRWVWPLPGRPAVLRGFDPPVHRWLPGHRGIDLDGQNGAPVLAVAAGIVSFSGSIAGVGVVSVLHDDGVLSTYQPVGDRASPGASVRAGDQIGLLGGGGGHCPPGTCLHLGARRGQTYLDPLLFLTDWEVSLLPSS